MRTWPFLLLTVLSMLCGAGAPAGEDPDDVGAAELAAVRARLRCSDADEAPFCEALDRFGTGEPLPLPAQPTSRVGRCLFFFGDHRETVGHMVADRNGLVSGQITPDNPEEEAQIGEAVTLLRAGAPLPPTHPVAQFVAALPGTMRGEPTRIEGRSRVYGRGERRFFRQTPTGEVVVLDMRDDGPHWVAFFP